MNMIKATLQLNLLVISFIYCIFTGASGKVDLETSILIQIFGSLSILASVKWTFLLGLILSFTTFTVPFWILLFNTQLTQASRMSEREQRFVFWEWLLYPVGTGIYSLGFFFYWVFRRMRRCHSEQESQNYKPEYFEANRSFIEFILGRKNKKSILAEKDLQLLEKRKLSGEVQSEAIN